jgi:hypothetical protein
MPCCGTQMRSRLQIGAMQRGSISRHIMGTEPSQPAGQELLDATLVVEFHPTNPHRPIGFGVRRSGKIVAILTEQNVTHALREFVAMRRRGKEATAWGSGHGN